MKVLALAVVFAVLVSGCTGYGPVESPSPTETPTVIETATPTETPTPTPEPSPEPTPEPSPSPSPTNPNLASFSVLSTDLRFEPREITVEKGKRVRITFTFNDSEIYFAGQDIKSNYFTVEYRPGQGNKTVEFTAEQDFDFRSYWPSSGVLKQVGKVNVTESA